jgi:hypothetical protein
MAITFLIPYDALSGLEMSQVTPVGRHPPGTRIATRCCGSTRPT